MMRARLAAALCLAAAASACTPGAVSASAAATGRIAGAIVIEVSLIKYAPVITADGAVAGYSPNPLENVPVGAVIQFHNQDTFAHTATFINNTNFPVNSPFTDAALTASGDDLSSPAWSTGEMNAGAYSQGFVASHSAKYFFGCFYHYNTPMRGVIQVGNV